MKVEISGGDELVERLLSLGDRVHRRLAGTMQRLGVDLHDAVLDNLSGKVLNRGTGTLAAAQELSLDESADAQAASVGFDAAAVPYGAIQEYGGTTRAHVIQAINAKALAFQVGGGTVFAKSVNHPGSQIPERSFLRSALAAMGQDAMQEIKSDVTAEVQA